MSHASSFRRLTATSLLSLHTLVTTLSFTVVVWGANAKLSPQVAVAQSSSPPNNTTGDRAPLPLVVPATPLDLPTQPIDPFDPLVAPSEPNRRTQFDLYRLGPGDTVSVLVNRFPDLSFNATVNPEGNIIAPLIGAIAVRGLTLEEVQERVRIGFNRYVIDPIVNVALTGQRPVQVTVLGEVTKPGFYPLNNPPRVAAALLAAGGATNRADLRNVRVRRTLMDGNVIEQRLDLFAPIADGAMLPDLRLEDGDAVVVDRLDVAQEKDYDRSLAARSTLSKQNITIRVLSYASNGIGNVNLANGSTFLDALTAISPNLQNARLKKIALVRFDPEQGRAVTRELNGKKALQGDVSQNVPLQDNDIIIVGRNLVARITYALNTFTQPFRDTLGFLLFFNELSNSASDLFGPGDNDDDDDN
jgi:polysaccharide export outer membrane protein